MTISRTYPVALCLALVSCLTGALTPETQGHEESAVAVEMSTAANRFLNSLDEGQRDQATFALNSPERVNWHFIPRERKGLPLKSLKPEQSTFAHALLASALSHRGYLQAATIMSLEAVLRDIEKGRGAVRDPALYYFSVFGKPHTTAPWAWRVEGHHLCVNMVVTGADGISATPSFFGGNPARVLSGSHQDLRVLGTEEDLGRELIQSLDEGQRAIAIINRTAPRDVILGPTREASLLTPAGLSYSKMNQEQRELLTTLISEYLFRYRAELARVEWSRIEKTGMNKVSFAWAGETEPGKGHYYRVQGPTFVLEYDNTQNNANHVHTVWRDPEGEFGVNLLRHHHEHGDHAH